MTVVKVLKKQPLGEGARCQGAGIFPCKWVAVVRGNQRPERVPIITGAGCQRSKRSSVITRRSEIVSSSHWAQGSEHWTPAGKTCPFSLLESVHHPSGLSSEVISKKLSLTLQTVDPTVCSQSHLYFSSVQVFPIVTKIICVTSSFIVYLLHSTHAPESGFPSRSPFYPYYWYGAVRGNISTSHSPWEGMRGTHTTGVS